MSTCLCSWEREGEKHQEEKLISLKRVSETHGINHPFAAAGLSPGGTGRIELGLRRPNLEFGEVKGKKGR